MADSATTQCQTLRVLRTLIASPDDTETYGHGHVALPAGTPPALAEAVYADMSNEVAAWAEGGTALLEALDVPGAPLGFDPSDAAALEALMIELPQGSTVHRVHLHEPDDAAVGILPPRGVLIAAAQVLAAACAREDHGAVRMAVEGVLLALIGVDRVPAEVLIDSLLWVGADGLAEGRSPVLPPAALARVRSAFLDHAVAGDDLGAVRARVVGTVLALVPGRDEGEWREQVEGLRRG